MKILGSFLLLIAVAIVANGVSAETNDTMLEKGRFITLKENDGHEVRAFVAGPVDARPQVAAM